MSDSKSNKLKLNRVFGKRSWSKYNKNETGTCCCLIERITIFPKELTDGRPCSLVLFKDKNGFFAKYFGLKLGVSLLPRTSNSRDLKCLAHHHCLRISNVNDNIIEIVKDPPNQL